MNYYFVTGSSKGIGEALVNILLQDSSNFVFGLSRTNLLQKKNYQFYSVDLSKIDDIASFCFPDLRKIDKIVLINNAGIIGDIKQMGKKEPQKIIDTFAVNTSAPALLMNQFAKQFQAVDAKKMILNISSGAGRHSIKSWAEYCASKSALDMLSLVMSDEQKEEKYPINIFSVAPGIIDTEMQEEIRSAQEEDFDKLDYFVDLKENNLLSSPHEVAMKLLKIINEQDLSEKVLLDVRDM